MADIYKMKLHDVIRTDSLYEVLRVPGGFIYTALSADRIPVPTASVFVPMNSEFRRSESA